MICIKLFEVVIMLQPTTTTMNIVFGIKMDLVLKVKKFPVYIKRENKSNITEKR